MTRLSAKSSPLPERVTRLVALLWRWDPPHRPTAHRAVGFNHSSLAFPKRKRPAKRLVFLFGAGDEARTRYLHLGKVALYRMSYTRISVRPSESNFFDSVRSELWCLRSESNQRHADFQSAALPTELQRHVAQSKLCAKHADAYLIGDLERTRTVDLQRDRLAC